MGRESLDRAWRTIAENRIQSAIEAGEFERLPGLGQPFEDLGDLYDPNWWLRAKLRREEWLPSVTRKSDAVQPLPVSRPDTNRQGTEAE